MPPIPMTPRITYLPSIVPERSSLIIALPRAAEALCGVASDKGLPSRQPSRPQISADSTRHYSGRTIAHGVNSVDLTARRGLRIIRAVSWTHGECDCVRRRLSFAP
jgi:hypothetical protein